MMKIIRFILGRLILLLDAIFVPKGLRRTHAEQFKVESETKDWRLYQLKACPFCVKVRREMKRLSLNIPILEIGQDEVAHAELMAGGKIDQVPCLMIPEGASQKRWLYESSEIVEFLQSRFSTVSA